MVTSSFTKPALDSRNVPSLMFTGRLLPTSGWAFAGLAAKRSRSRLLGQFVWPVKSQLSLGDLQRTKTR